MLQREPPGTERGGRRCIEDLRYFWGVRSPWRTLLRGVRGSFGGIPPPPPPPSAQQHQLLAVCLHTAGRKVANASAWTKLIPWLGLRLALRFAWAMDLFVRDPTPVTESAPRPNHPRRREEPPV